MIASFTGDAFLARRAARRLLAERGFNGSAIVELTAPFEVAEVARAAGQGGLFGDVAVLLDITEAFPGQAGTKPRNELLAAVSELRSGSLIVIVEAGATDARRRSLAALGEHSDLPTPRFDALPRWVAAELKAAGIATDGDVPQLLADIFGEEPAEIASEIGKLALLDERLSVERVRRLVNRAVSRDAFDLIDAIATGDAAGALAITKLLEASGEAPQRVFGALTWQFLLVAKTAALLLREAPRRVSAQQAAGVLKVKPFAAQKALNLARGLSEAAILELLAQLQAADLKAKSGGDPQLALETVVISLAGRWAAGAAPSQRAGSATRTAPAARSG